MRSLTQRSVSGSRPPAPKLELETEPEIAEEEKEVPVNKLQQLSPTEPATVVVAEPEKASAPEPAGEAQDEFEEVETISGPDHDEVTVAQQRLSVQSNGQLDEVSLHDEDPSDDVKGSDTNRRSSKKLAWLTGHDTEQEAVKMSPSEPEPPEPPKKTISLSSITGSLPAMPWSPGPQGQTSPKNLDTPPATAPAAPTSPGTPPANSVPAAASAPPPTRKLAGAFSWLSRNSSKDLTNVLPPVVSPRRNTASSTTTLTSNPDMMLGRLDEEGRPMNARHSLKDRFKAMRMREEAGITSLPDDGEPNGIANLVNKGPNGITPTPAEEKDTVQPPPSPQPPHLAPGTASGATAGPTDQQVDWDLWQSVVNEGPAAVAKTSAEELNKAIATGIPSAIRGVIWQVLAQSQSEELEAVYRELVARGTDKEKDHQSNGSLSVGSNGSSLKESSSSASSVHSHDSGFNGAPSPPPKDFPKEDEATRLKKKKEDAAMISRLEKVIRRDLGARTAYSKFASAPGLQEGLYGVCKSYALFDEEVGYAQGMNFLIMPLLFNVRQNPRNTHEPTKTDSHTDDGGRGVLSACQVDEQLPPAGSFYTRHARFAYAFVPIRAFTGRYAASTLLSFEATRHLSPSLRHAVVPYPVLLPLPTPACPPHLRPHPVGRSVGDSQIRHRVDAEKRGYTPRHERHVPAHQLPPGPPFRRIH